MKNFWDKRVSAFTKQALTNALNNLDEWTDLKEGIDAGTRFRGSIRGIDTFDDLSDALFRLRNSEAGGDVASNYKMVNYSIEDPQGVHIPLNVRQSISEAAREELINTLDEMDSPLKKELGRWFDGGYETKPFSPRMAVNRIAAGRRPMEVLSSTRYSPLTKALLELNDPLAKSVPKVGDVLQSRFGSSWSSYLNPLDRIPAVGNLSTDGPAYKFDIKSPHSVLDVSSLSPQFERETRFLPGQQFRVEDVARDLEPLHSGKPQTIALGLSPVKGAFKTIPTRLLSAMPYVDIVRTITQAALDPEFKGQDTIGYLNNILGEHVPAPGPNRRKWLEDQIMA